MTTQLQAMVDFLSGREGAGSDRVRSELADPEGDAARFLEAVRRLSRNALGPPVFKGLGLPRSMGGRVPDVAARPPHSAHRRFLGILPWLTTSLAAGAAVWLLLTCPCRHAKPQGTAPAVAALVPSADGGATVPTPAATPSMQPDPTPGGVAAPSPLPKDNPAMEIEIPANGPKLLPSRQSNAREDDLLGQIDDLQLRLKATAADTAAANARVAELEAKLRADEVKNGRLSSQAAGLTQELQREQTKEDKLRRETEVLAAQLTRSKKEQTQVAGATVTTQIASLQETLEKVREQLRGELAKNEQLRKQLDEQIKSVQAAREEAAKLRQEAQALSDKLRGKQVAKARRR
jgi:hypothetical protein